MGLGLAMGLALTFDLGFRGNKGRIMGRVGIMRDFGH